MTWHLGLAEPWISTTSVFTNGMCDTDSPPFKLQTCQGFEKRISCNAKTSYRTSHNYSVQPSTSVQMFQWYLLFPLSLYMIEAHIPLKHWYSSARLHSVIYKDDSHHHSHCHKKLKVHSNYNDNLCERNTGSLCTHSAGNCNLQLPRTEQIKLTWKTASCGWSIWGQYFNLWVWEQGVLNIQILKNANIHWGWSHKWNCAMHSRLSRAQIRRNKMLKM